MFPIRDHNPSGRIPFVTYALIGINVAIFLVYLPILDDTRRLAFLYRDWALTPARHVPLTFLTSIFLHASFMHLFGNMLFLFIFGDNLEDEMGHGGFLAFYLACGIAAGLVHVHFSPGSHVPLVGASGAIAGVMGGYLLMFPRARVDVLLVIIILIRIIPVPAWLMLGFWFALQLVNAMGSDPNMGGVAHWAHTGGFVVGVLFTLPLWLRRGGPAFWNRNRGQPPHPSVRYRRSDVPRVRRRDSDVPRVRRRP